MHPTRLVEQTQNRPPVIRSKISVLLSEFAKHPVRQCQIYVLAREPVGI